MGLILDEIDGFEIEIRSASFVIYDESGEAIEYPLEKLTGLRKALDRAAKHVAKQLAD